MSDDRGARDLERRLSEFILSSMGATIESIVKVQLQEALKDLEPPPGTASKDYVDQAVRNLELSKGSLELKQWEQAEQLRRQDVAFGHHAALLETLDENVNAFATALKERGIEVDVVPPPEKISDTADKTHVRPGFVGLRLPKFGGPTSIILIVVTTLLLMAAAYWVGVASTAGKQAAEKTNAEPAPTTLDSGPPTVMNDVSLGATKVRAMRPDGDLAKICPEDRPCDLGSAYDVQTDTTKVLVLQETVEALYAAGKCQGTPKRDGKLETANSELNYRSKCLEKIGVEPRTGALEHADVKQLTLDLLTVLGRQ